MNPAMLICVFFAPGDGKQMDLDEKIDEAKGNQAGSSMSKASTAGKKKMTSQREDDIKSSCPMCKKICSNQLMLSQHMHKCGKTESAGDTDVVSQDNKIGTAVQDLNRLCQLLSRTLKRVDDGESCLWTISVMITIMLFSSTVSVMHIKEQTL